MAEAAADGTRRRAAFLAMRPRCAGGRTLRRGDPPARGLTPAPHRAARRAREAFVETFASVRQITAASRRASIGRRLGGGLDGDSPDLDPDLDVDHNMMRYLDLMDVRSRIGDEGFVASFGGMASGFRGFVARIRTTSKGY